MRSAVGAMILVSITNYWLLIPTLILIVLLLTFRRIYINSARSVKRLEAICKSSNAKHQNQMLLTDLNVNFFVFSARSPILAHTNATITGLSTIRSCGAQKILEKEFDSLQDFSSSLSFIFIATTRALCLWLETSCVFYLSVTLCVFLIYQKSINVFQTLHYHSNKLVKKYICLYLFRHIR